MLITLTNFNYDCESITFSLTALDKKIHKDHTMVFKGTKAYKLIKSLMASHIICTDKKSIELEVKSIKCAGGFVLYSPKFIRTF